jgi:hypothetical protein
MPYYPLPDPEDPDWAEIMYELCPEARPLPPKDYFIIDLTRKGCGIRGYRQADNGWKPTHKFEIMPSFVEKREVEVIDLTLE